MGSGNQIMVCRRFLISGKVQGVWFRESTRREAERLGLQGSAVNLPDGRVEVIAAGPESAMSSLSSWLKRGPPMARVDKVIQENMKNPGLSGFKTT